MIEKTLTQLGFKQKEIEVYLELLKRGKATHAALSKATGINRGTVYSVAKSLLEYGVIAQDLAGGSSQYLVALPADDLTALIDKREKETKRQRRLVHKAIDELAGLPTGIHYAVPQIRFVEDENVEDHLYKQTPIWQKSILKADGTWWGFQDPSFVEHYEEWLDWYWSIASADEYVKLLSNEAQSEERMAGKGLTRREIVFWKKNVDFTATTWALGDYLVMIYTNEKPFYLIEIHNPMLAHNMREMFKGIWRDLS